MEYDSPFWFFAHYAFKGFIFAIVVYLTTFFTTHIKHWINDWKSDI